MNDLTALLPIILLVLIFYFLIIRPQSKRRREFVSLQNQVAVGARVMITSGIYGTVVSLGDDTMEIEIAPGTVIEVHRNVVAKIVEPAPAVDAPAVEETVDSDRPIERRADDENGTA